ANRDAALLVLGKQPVGAQGNRDVEAAPDLHAEKRRRRDADYWNQMTIETDGATQDPGVARELPLPERMAEHDSRAPAGLSIVFCGDCPPYHRTHSQETEKLAAHIEPFGVTRFASVREIEARCAPGEHAHEGLLLRSDVV